MSAVRRMTYSSPLRSAVERTDPDNGMRDDVVYIREQNTVQYLGWRAFLINGETQQLVL